MNCSYDEITKLVKRLSELDTSNMHMNDFLLTWGKKDHEIEATLVVANLLQQMRKKNISSKIFNSGLGISIFRDNSTRTRFSFTSACNLLGLGVQDFDESKSQVAHGETFRETANMISFMADVVGIRDDMYIGQGHTYMKDFSDYVSEGFNEGVLEQKPSLVNLQCDIDHPTQTMSDLLYLVKELGSIENLRNKKVVMSWAYSPSYGKPLSVPQGIIGLLSRFGVELVLAHPEGYELMPDVEKIAIENSKCSGGKFTKTNDMKEAFKGAHVVYPKSWAPFAAMKKRSELRLNNDINGINDLEKKLLIQNANFKNWECTEDLIKSTNNGKAIYMHCLPADITGVSCKEGEVVSSVFDRYRKALYLEASYKPYIIASMIFLSKSKNPSELIKKLLENKKSRIF